MLQEHNFSMAFIVSPANVMCAGVFEVIITILRLVLNHAVGSNKGVHSRFHPKNALVCICCSAGAGLSLVKVLASASSYYRNGSHKREMALSGLSWHVSCMHVYFYY